MTAIRTTSVTIANAGDTTITVNDGVDFSEVVPSSSIQIDGIAANLIIDSGTEPVDGVSTLTLRTGYPAGLALPTAYGATITIGSNAFKNMANQLKTQVDYVSDSAKIVSDYGSTNNTSFSWPAIDGSTTTVKTPLAMQAEVDTITTDANNLVNALGLSTEADFQARRELVKSDKKRIGSGVVETGSGSNWGEVDWVGDGFYCKTSSSFPNNVFLSGSGISGGSNPVLDFDGVKFEIAYLNYDDDNFSLFGTPEAITATVEAEFAYANESFSVAGEGDNPNGLLYALDHIWVVGNNTDSIRKYTTTGTYTGTSISVGTQDNNPSGVAFDGTYFYVVGTVSKSVHQYTAAGVYTGTSFSVANEIVVPTDIHYYNGHFYVIGNQNDAVYKYTAAGVYTGTSFSVANDGSALGITFCAGHFWVIGNDTDAAYQYTVNGVYTGVSFNVSAQDDAPPGIASDGENIYIVGNATDSVYKYSPKITADKTTHDWVVHGNNAYCCIADSTAGDLLTDTTKFRHSPEGVVRENLAAAEAFLVPLTGTGKRPFYPRGLVQNAQASYGGVTMSATSGLGISGVDAGYCRFGEWDSSTDGLGCDFEALTSAQKVNLGILEGQRLFVGSDGVVYQWHLRAKVFRGFGCGWAQEGVINPETATGNEYLRFESKAVKPQGMLNSAQELGAVVDGSSGYFTVAGSDYNFLDHDVQIFGATNQGTNGIDSGVGINGQCYIMPLFLHTQGNTGGYHPLVGNEFGHRKLNATGGTVSGAIFGNSTEIQPSSLADCFNIIADPTTDNTSAGAAIQSGSIGSGGSGRPDGKYYDAVYPEQIRSLRNLTHNPDTTVNGLSYDAVSNQIRGWQGMPRVYKLLDETITTTGSGVYNTDNGGRILIATSDSTNPRDTASSIFEHLIQEQITHWILFGDNGEVMKIPRLARTGMSSLSYWPWSNNTANINGLGNPEIISEFNAKFPSGTVLSIGCEYESAVTVSGEYSTSCFFGAPERLKETMDKYSQEFVYGKWFPPIPDGTSQDFKILSDKVISNLGRIYTADDGTTWQSATGDSSDFIGSSNSVSQNWSADLLLIQSYTTYANGWESASRGSVDDAEFSDVIASNVYLTDFGSVFCSHLFGEVPISSETLHTMNIGNLSGYLIMSDGLVSKSSVTTPAHETIDLGGTSTGFKFASYMSTDDNGITTHYAMAKQIKYDAALDNGAEFTDITEATVTKTAGVNYHITDGRFTGYWQCLTSVTTLLSDTRWYEQDGYIKFQDGVAYFKKWDGNGWTDNDQIEVVDGVTVIESESPDIYVQVGTFSHKDPLNRV